MMPRSSVAGPGGWWTDPLGHEKTGAAGRRLVGTGARRILSLALLVGGLIAPGMAAAQQPAGGALVGRRVVQRDGGFALRIERRVINVRRVLNFYRVDQADGPWVWVRAEGSGLSGWALADQVIPVEEAVEFFGERIQTSPGDAFAYVMRALLWQDRNLTDRALRDFDAAIALEPNRAWIYNNRGLLHLERRDYSKAEADFDEAIRLEPRNANVYNNRGTLRRERKLYEPAAGDFTEAIRLNPEYAIAYYNRGLTRSDEHDYDRAIGDFSEVIRLAPDDAMAYYQRGLAWSAREQYDNAIVDYDRAIQLDDKQPLIYRDRGIARAARKEFARAIADYDRSLVLAPARPWTYYRRGLARAELGRFDKALADYDEAIRLDPRFDEAYLARAWLLATCPDARIRDPKKAVESATRACELTGWHKPHDLGGLAAVYAETGNVAAALKWHSRALELLTAEGKESSAALAPLGHH